MYRLAVHHYFILFHMTISIHIWMGARRYSVPMECVGYAAVYACADLEWKHMNPVKYIRAGQLGHLCNSKCKEA